MWTPPSSPHSPPQTFVVEERSRNTFAVGAGIERLVGRRNPRLVEGEGVGAGKGSTRTHRRRLRQVRRDTFDRARLVSRGAKTREGGGGFFRRRMFFCREGERDGGMLGRIRLS